MSNYGQSGIQQLRSEWENEWSKPFLKMDKDMIGYTADVGFKFVILCAVAIWILSVGFDWTDDPLGFMLLLSG